MDNIETPKRETLSAENEEEYEEVDEELTNDSSGNGNSEEVEDSEESKKVISLCEEFEYVQLEPIGTANCQNVEASEEEVDDEDEELAESDEARIQRKCELKLMDTLKCKDFLNEFVKVVTADGKRHFGVLICLDPMSGDMIIQKVNENKPGAIKRTLIFQETCISVTLLDETKSKNGVLTVQPFFTLKKLKNQLISWFKDNDISVYLKGENSLLVFDIATIDAPYGPDDVYCDDPIVLKRTKTILQSLTQKKQKSRKKRN